MFALLVQEVHVVHGNEECCSASALRANALPEQGLMALVRRVLPARYRIFRR